MSQHVLGDSISMICGYPVPFRGVFIGLPDFSAFLIHLTQSVLSFGIPLVDGFLEQFHDFRIGFLYASALMLQSQHVLGIGMSLLGGFPDPFECISI